MLKTAKLSIFFGLLLFSLVFVQASFAQQVLPGNSAANSNKNSTKEANPVAATNTSEKAVMARDKAGSQAAMTKKNNLTQARYKVCQSRQERISNRFANLKSLGARVYQNYEGFEARVDYFYTNTLIPGGYVLENYDELRDQIALNKEAAVQAMEQVRLSGQDFSCDSEDPKAQTNNFRTNMQALIAANKEYKVSVREFVVAVRDLAKEARAATLTTTPEVPVDATSGAEVVSE